MEQHVTVIPTDRAIQLNGMSLVFDFKSDANLHALQWHEGSGHIEFKDSSPNLELSEDDYTEQVEPFVAMWQAEYERLQAEFNKAPELEVSSSLALSALREKRKAVEYGGVIIDGVRWDSESKDELRINSIIKLFENGTLSSYEGWKVADGVYISLTPELLQKAMAAFMLHYSDSFAVEAAKIAEIKAITAKYQAQLDAASPDKEESILHEASEALQAWIETDLNEGWSDGI